MSVDRAGGADIVVPPPALVSSVVAEISMRGLDPTKLMEALLGVAFVVVIDVPRSTEPLPLCVKGPSEEIVSFTVVVNVLLFAIVIGPPFVVVTSSKKVRLAHVMDIPEAPSVLIVPLICVSPVPLF